MKFVIWGAGTFGKKTCLAMSNYSNYNIEVIAFIDKNKSGSILFDKPVISFKEYLTNYKNYIIVIGVYSVIAIEEITKELEKAGITHYLIMRDAPIDFHLQFAYKPMPFDELTKMVGISSIKSLNIAICGINPFSYVYKCFLEDHDCNVSLCSTIPTSNSINKYDYIIITQENLWQNSFVNITNIIPFFNFIKWNGYKNNRLSKFKDLCKDKRCFIVATGASLRLEDLDLLYKNNEICISMNRVYVAFDKTLWRPDYYVVTDERLLKICADELINLELPYKLIGDHYPLFWDKYSESENIYRYHSHSLDFEKNGTKFSDDLTIGIYNSRTIVYDCIQFAVYLGCKSIYLLGVDCYAPAPKDSDKNYFIEGYNKSGTHDLESDNDYSNVVPVYEIARHYANLHGIKIYNATRGGRLEVFERVNFENLFKNK